MEAAFPFPLDNPFADESFDLQSRSGCRDDRPVLAWPVLGEHRWGGGGRVLRGGGVVSFQGSDGSLLCPVICHMSTPWCGTGVAQNRSSTGSRPDAAKLVPTERRRYTECCPERSGIFCGMLCE